MKCKDNTAIQKAKLSNNGNLKKTMALKFGLKWICCRVIINKLLKIFVN